jgi:hypothetical protein
MNAPDLLREARQLIDIAANETTGLWARAAAMLARQSLELALRDILAREAPGAHAAPFRTQLLVFRSLHHGDELPARIAYTWVALSQSTHYQGYELPPTAEALRGWIETVHALLSFEARES